MIGSLAGPLRRIHEVGHQIPPHPGPLPKAEHYPHLSARQGESQRDSILQPRVARNELPWGWWLQDSPTLKGLRQWFWPSERQAAPLSGLVGFVDGFPRVGPPAPFSPAIQPWANGRNPFGIGRNFTPRCGQCLAFGRGEGDRILDHVTPGGARGLAVPGLLSETPAGFWRRGLSSFPGSTPGVSFRVSQRRGGSFKFTVPTALATG